MSSGQVEHQGNERESRGIRFRRFVQERKGRVTEGTRQAATDPLRDSFSGELAEVLALPPALEAVQRNLQAGTQDPQPFAREAISSRQEFLWQLRRERLRTNRCGAPLSLVVFSVDGRNQPNQPGCVRELLETLAERKRETDLLGYLGKNFVGVLRSEERR